MHGFELTEEFKKEGFSGGTIQCGPGGQTFDVGKAIKEGDGVIHTDDDLFAQVLSSYPALQRVPEDKVSKDAQPVELPYKLVTQEAATPQPWIPQGGESLPQQRVEVQQGEGEVPAEHADEPADEQQAVAQGEAVSSGPSKGDQSTQSQSSEGSRFPQGKSSKS